MTTYIMTLRVGAKRLPTILEALQGAAELIGLSVEAASPEPSPAAPSRYVNGKRKKIKTGKELILDTLRASPAPMSAAALHLLFEKNGFAGTSYPPVISKLKAAKQVIVCEDGRYKLAPGA